jgi:diguanylate cyclase (GGDEF)-like protein/hemerythrin-like metal-binding protein/PAS domain S-box-containing protein
LQTRPTKKGQRDEIFADGRPFVGQEALLTVDADLCVLDANAATWVWGEPRENLRGQKFCDLFASPEAALTLYSRALELGLAQGHFLEARSQDSSIIQLLCRAERLKGRAKLVRVVARRVSRTVGPEGALGDASPMFRDAFECANIAMALVDPAGNLLKANQKTAETFGFSAQELESMHLSDLIYAGNHHFSEDPASGHLEVALDRGSSERQFLHRNGMILFIDFSFAMVRDEAGNPRYVVASFRDVTGRRRLEILLKEQASVDPLTRTMNRTWLEERGKVELLRAERYQHKFSVAMVDLDRFKVVNDTYGHAAGDQVLRGFVEVGHSCLRLTDEMGRWGGEEFVILLPDTGPGGAARVAERMRAALEEFIFSDGIRMTASIGIAACRKGESFAGLISRADAAMYRAKNEGRNRVTIDERDLAEAPAFKPTVQPLIQLQWKKAYASGQSVIDGEHREMMQAANRLLVAGSRDESAAEISSLIGELVEHARTHFRHEEELLTVAHYPRYEEHRAIHRKLLAKVEGMQVRLDLGESTVGDVLGFVIHDLVARHLLREDREFFPWVKGFTLPAGKAE